MKETKGVQGSMEKVQVIEVNVDTVYVRSNIVRVETEQFTGWQYDEIQYNLKEYIGLIAEEKDNLAQQITDININLAEMIGVE